LGKGGIDSLCIKTQEEKIGELGGGRENSNKKKGGVYYVTQGEKISLHLGRTGEAISTFNSTSREGIGKDISTDLRE